MPSEYLNCVKEEEAKGRSHKEAQRICAIRYYKQHGRTPQQDEGKSTLSEYAQSIFAAIEVIDEAFGAKWKTAKKNDLLDSAFLWIESGGKKDESGRTVPRSLRHLPYKNADGKIDCAHLRNAIARANQVQGASPEKKTALKARAQSLYNKHCGGGS